MSQRDLRIFYRRVQQTMNEEHSQQFRDTAEERKTAYLADIFHIEPLTTLYRHIQDFYTSLLNGESQRCDNSWHNILTLQDYFNMSAYSVNVFMGGLAYCIGTDDYSGLQILAFLSCRPDIFTAGYLEQQYRLDGRDCPTDVRELFFPELRPAKKRALMPYIS
jgi:hypothetical protein